MPGHAKDVTLVLHIGLHKTATSYVQNVLSMRRYDLLRHGVLYPTTGAVDEVPVSTRSGAQSGHANFFWAKDRGDLVSQLLTELPQAASTVLLSSEDFSLPRRRPFVERLLGDFSAFGTIKVVLVLRRQDAWIESYYKQLVDQYGNFETRSFDEFLRQAGPNLLDFHTRFSLWRDLVGPDNFHVLSYDDLLEGAAIYRRILEGMGIGDELLEVDESAHLPIYESVRAIDTLGLRILNSYRLDSREVRTGIARSIYAAAPDGDVDLMTPGMRDGIQQMCGPINEKIEAEWFSEPVPGFRFGSPAHHSAVSSPTGLEVVDYLNHVISLCEAARRTADEDRRPGE
ncbi:MAG TPA: hypothetical protein VFI99_02810 [Nocardioides sp.]|nr:hypothetical protein [Nocardioides sp.]